MFVKKYSKPSKYFYFFKTRVSGIIIFIFNKFIYGKYLNLIIQNNYNFLKKNKKVEKDIIEEVKIVFKELKNTLAPNAFTKDKFRQDCFHFQYLMVLKSLGFKPQNILEFGTYYGVTTSYMAYLWPNASIYSLDLPKNHYQYKKYFPDNISSIRENNLKSIKNKFKNVFYIRESSLKVNFETFPEMDLIYLDGNHDFPLVSIDFFNSINCLNLDNKSKEKVIILDDVRPSFLCEIGFRLGNLDRMGMDHVYRSMKLYEEEFNLSFNLYKRDDRSNNQANSSFFIDPCCQAVYSNRKKYF